MITICLEKLHRHPAELENLPLWAFWEIIAIAKMEAEEMEEKLEES